MPYCFRCWEPLEGEECHECGYNPVFKQGVRHPVKLYIPGGDPEKGFRLMLDRVNETVRQYDRELTRLVKKVESNFSATRDDIPVYLFSSVEEDRGKAMLVRALYLLRQKSDRDPLEGFHEYIDRRPHEFNQLVGAVKSGFMNPDQLFNRDSVAGYNPPYQKDREKRQDSLHLKLLPRQMVDFEELPEALKPLFEYLNRREFHGEELKEKLAHEMTHAYITSRYDSERFNRHEKMGAHHLGATVDAVNEAASTAVTYRLNQDYVEGEAFPTTANYRSDDIPKSVLQSGIQAFLYYTEGEKPRKAVSMIRERAVEVIQRLIDEDVEHDPVELIAGEKHGDLERVHEVTKAIEEAEYHFYHALILLDIIDPKNAKKWAKKYGDTPDYWNSFGRNDMFRDDLQTIQKGIHELEKTVQEGGMEPREIQAVQQCISDLVNAINKYRSETSFYHNSYCTDCGAQVEPDHSYCGYCGKELSYAEERSLEFLNAHMSSILAGMGRDDLKVDQEIQDSRIENPLQILMPYMDMVRTGIKYNQEILEALQQLHDDEELAAQSVAEASKEKEEVGQMLEITEEAYGYAQKADENLRHALEVLETVKDRYL
ncbi:MAG: zinc ribbon domain-containing protein [Candidatus Nanohaloarchaea archaeon]